MGSSAQIRGTHQRRTTGTASGWTRSLSRQLHQRLDPQVLRRPGAQDQRLRESEQCPWLPRKRRRPQHHRRHGLRRRVQLLPARHNLLASPASHIPCLSRVIGLAAVLLVLVLRDRWHRVGLHEEVRRRRRRRPPHQKRRPVLSLYKPECPTSKAPPPLCLLLRISTCVLSSLVAVVACPGPSPLGVGRIPLVCGACACFSF